jgi:hypothetical protein
VVSAISLLVAAAGVVFGIYQWGRQRGRVRVQVDEIQAEMYLRVIIDAPTPVHVNGIAYQIKARGRVRRLLRWLRDDDLRFHRRFVAIWRFRDFDVAIGWLERTTEWNEANSAACAGLDGHAPIAGPPFPTTISGYDDASWKLYGVNYVPMLRSMLDGWAEKNPKLRFRVVVSGHPRRVVHSSWIPIRHLSMLKPENQHWMDVDQGQPQVPSDGSQDL